jgi:CTP synthase
MQPKYLFITGGVVSSLGKGLTTAALGALLESMGLEVAFLKLDPYFNVDPGTMNPFQHGEVYVTDDGAETDLDLGHYYRFSHAQLTRASNATSGQIYNAVLKRERHGDYLGQTVQVIPHITDEIKRRIIDCTKETGATSVVLVEIGGTVGDIESLPILEAIRQFRQQRPSDCLNIHLTYVPYLEAAGEIKTKPTQHSVQTLRGIGIIPDIIICRCRLPLGREIKEKISLFCSVPSEAVIEAADVEKTIYELPLKMQQEGLDTLICSRLNLPQRGKDLQPWRQIVKTVSHPKGRVTVGIIGKYVKHQDAYKSLYEALHHGALAHGYALEIRTFEAEKLTRQPDVEAVIQGCDGYLVPGGFGERGWQGKLEAARICREQKIPFFGICLGMQAMVTEFARNVAGWADANSTEVDPDTHYPVISLLSEQREVEDLGGTMRLGSSPCDLAPNSSVAKIYQKMRIEERHRHRYEFNNQFSEQLAEKGLLQTGIYAERKLVEVVEVQGHPWMIGVQYHPEFKSKPTAPHPLFASFAAAMIEYHG